MYKIFENYLNKNIGYNGINDIEKVLKMVLRCIKKDVVQIKIKEL